MGAISATEPGDKRGDEDPPVKPGGLSPPVSGELSENAGTVPSSGLLIQSPTRLSTSATTLDTGAWRLSLNCARLNDGLRQNEISDVLELLKSRVVERGRGISTPVGAEEKTKRQQALISTVAHHSASDRGGQGASGRRGTTSGWVSSVQAARAFDGIGRHLGGQAVRGQPRSRRSPLCHPGEFLASAAV